MYHYSCAAFDVLYVIAIQEFAYFLIDIFFPFVRDEQQRAAEVGEHSSTQGVNDASMCFIHAWVDNDKTSCCVDDSADGYVSVGRFRHVYQIEVHSIPKDNCLRL